MFTIRLGTERDAAALLAIYQPYVLETAITFEYVTPTIDAFTRRMHDALTVFPWLVAEHDGAVAGYAYATHPFTRAAYQWNAELSVYLRPESQGYGFGKNIYQALLELLTQQGVCNAYGVITASNHKSITMHEQLGFHRMGHFTRVGYKLGRWHDVIWLEKTLNEYTDEPCPLTSPTALAGPFSAALERYAKS